MPCPEKFKETLQEFGIEKDIINKINDGYENLVSGSPKKEKAAYFKRATDILVEEVDIDTVHKLYISNSCCKGGLREKASKEFAKKYADLPYFERLKHICEVPYMGAPVLESDNVICVNAVNYGVSGKYSCACSNYNKAGFTEKVAKDYCYCCAGHFLHHYKIMLGINLSVMDIVSSPLDSEGSMPCVIRFHID